MGDSDSQGNSSHRETRLTEELVSQGNSSHRETRVTGKPVSQRNSFFVNSTKPFILILVVKHLTCNTKVGEITVL